MAEHRFYRGDKNEREVTSDGAGTFGPRLTAKYERRFHVGVAKLCSAFLGLTLLAAAYAEKHRSDYRAIWWIRRRPRPPCAPISSRSAYGSAGLADDKENDVLADVMERLRDKGDGPLLIDNAIDANELTYLPRGIGTCWRHLSFLVGASIVHLAWPFFHRRLSSPFVPSLQPQSPQLIALLFRLLGERGKLMAVHLISAAVIDSPCH
jgi:hypothetical protein